MNHAIAGKPGGGKGMLSVHLVVDELVNGKRPIITDVAFEKLPWCTAQHEPRRGLLDYLHEKHGKDFVAVERLFRLTPEAQLNYFLYRALNREQVEKMGAMHMIGYREVTPLDKVLVESEWQFHKDYKLYEANHVSHLDKRGRKVVDSYDTALAIASGGHLIITDEAWSKWPARGWSGTSEGVLYYYSMVRRFGDDNYITSQRTGDVDKILIDRCEDYWVCKNHGKGRWAFWRQPSVFLVSVYDHCPNSLSDPMYRKPFFLDRKGLAQCYDTSGGVGVAGRVMADTNTQTKGLPFWSVFVIGAAAVVGLILLVQGCQHKMSAMLSGKKSVLVAKNVSENLTSDSQRPLSVEKKSENSPEKAIAGEPGFSAGAPGFATLTNANQISLPSVPTVPPVVTNELYCTGYFGDGKYFTVFLSDGTTVDTESGRINQIQKHFVIIDGVKLNIKTPRFVAPPVAAAKVDARAEASANLDPGIVEIPQRTQRPLFGGGIVVTPPVGGSH